MTSTRVHIAHDWLVGLRGGEFVLDRLAQLFGPTVLYTLVDNGRPLTAAISACDVRTSPLQQLPGAAGRLRRWYLPLMPRAVERIQVEDCDLLISTSSAVMKSIRPPAGAAHLCYCHSPARYIWDQMDDYSIGGRGRLRRAGLQTVRRHFQDWDRRTADRVTLFLANSSHTARRIHGCYGREAEIVHPPVRTEVFTPDEHTPREDWYLVVAALEPYKRTDLAIRAAQRSGIALKVVGSGSQFEELRRMARGAAIELLGRVDDEQLLHLYRRARALIFPQLEDFGIVAVEAQAAGCPVIAFNRGGAAETVTRETGVFFDEQSVEAVVNAVHRFEQRSFDPESCRTNALRFSEAVFDEAILAHAQRLLSSG